MARRQRVLDDGTRRYRRVRRRLTDSQWGCLIFLASLLLVVGGTVAIVIWALKESTFGPGD